MVNILFLKTFLIIFEEVYFPSAVFEIVNKRKEHNSNSMEGSSEVWNNIIEKPG